MKKIMFVSAFFSVALLSILSFRHTPPAPVATPAAAPTTAIKTAYKPFVVLELFTSEGCSSCPSADEALREVAGRDGVLAVGFHVTYWNRLGWKDAFSVPAFDDRQYKYAEKFKASGVYTPQLVVDGEDEFVGSKKSQLDKAIQKSLSQTPTAGVELSTVKKDNSIVADYQLAGDLANKELHLALVERNVVSKVSRGENSGRTLRHDNVVRDFQTVDIQSGASGKYTFSLLPAYNLANCLVIAYLQDKTTSKIVGGAKQAVAL